MTPILTEHTPSHRVSVVELAPVITLRVLLYIVALSIISQQTSELHFHQIAHIAALKAYFLPECEVSMRAQMSLSKATQSAETVKRRNGVKDRLF